MKQIKNACFILLVSIFSLSAFAGDFDWIKDFNIQAQADPSGLKTKLSARFQVGDLKINTVLSNVEKPADAYMVLRLGEISKQPIDTVLDKYKTQRDKGWGAFAKSLGIKPGSKEFHDLKNGQDLYSDKEKSQNKGKMKEKGNKGKGKK